MRREAGRPVLETVRLTASDDGLRVVQLSDIHIKRNCIPIEEVLTLVNSAAPDVVVFTGDYIESSKDVGPFLSWIGALIESARGAAFYLCYGNHDAKVFSYNPRLRRDFTKALKRLGVYVLENRTVVRAFNGKLYAITGFSDYYSTPPYDARAAMGGIPKDAYRHIGMSHNPDVALDIRGARPDLLLLGHFHGGQIWLPFGVEYACLRKERLCKAGVRRGLYEYGGRRIYISRGLGCVLFPLRFRSRPEITLLIV